MRDESVSLTRSDRPRGKLTRGWDEASLLKTERKTTYFIFWNSTTYHPQDVWGQSETWTFVSGWTAFYLISFHLSSTLNRGIRFFLHSRCCTAHLKFIFNIHFLIFSLFLFQHSYFRNSVKNYNIFFPQHLNPNSVLFFMTDQRNQTNIHSHKNTNT